MSDWISVKDRLPEDGQLIVGINSDCCAWIEVWDSQESVGSMVYWMQCQQLPEEVENELLRTD